MSVHSEHLIGTDRYDHQILFMTMLGIVVVVLMAVFF